MFVVQEQSIGHLNFLKIKMKKRIIDHEMI